ncbi:GntR family transcriptional regulator [Streptomyces sp. NPDC001984]|uniref:GntR family transcriptional regulator n=1 Tax=Streptomyces sp. NPDC002619 TaxID=3364655 RepID=UPI003694554C
MSDQVIEIVRDMIWTGELPAGQQITHEQIAEALDVSTMPVREALLRLTHEGLIESGAKARSFQVSVTTADDVRDIYWLHSQLAGELAARAALRLDDEQISALEQAHEKWLAAAEASDIDALEWANDSFHRVINLGANSPKLVGILLNTLRLIPHQYYKIAPQQIAHSTKAHVKILKAMVAHDAEAARKAAQQHVLDSADVLIKNFDDNGYWVRPVEGAPSAGRH